MAAKVADLKEIWASLVRAVSPDLLPSECSFCYAPIVLGAHPFQFPIPNPSLPTFRVYTVPKQGNSNNVAHTAVSPLATIGAH